MERKEIGKCREAQKKHACKLSLWSDRVNGVEVMFEEIVPKNFPKLLKNSLIFKTHCELQAGKIENNSHLDVI